MRGEAKAFRGLWVEPLDGGEYRWRCRSCGWELDQEHGDDVTEALDSYLAHECPGGYPVTRERGCSHCGGRRENPRWRICESCYGTVQTQHLDRLCRRPRRCPHKVVESQP